MCVCYNNLTTFQINEALLEAFAKIHYELRHWLCYFHIK